MDIGSPAVGGETDACRNELIETEFPNPRIPNRQVFLCKDGAPEFVPVLRAGGKNEAGVIERVRAAHNELGIKWINDRPIDIAVDVEKPLLRAVRVEGKELA